MMSSIGGGTGAGAPPQMDLYGFELHMIMKAKDASDAVPKKKEGKEIILNCRHSHFPMQVISKAD